MNLNPLEQHIFAFFLVKEADQVNIAGRFFPRKDFISTFEDKMRISLRKFGRGVSGNAQPVAEQFVDLLLEKGALSTQTDKFGGVMHQFQAEPYRAVISDLRNADPVVAKAQASGDAFWDETFAGLVA